MAAFGVNNRDHNSSNSNGIINSEKVYCFFNKYKQKIFLRKPVQPFSSIMSHSGMMSLPYDGEPEWLCWINPQMVGGRAKKMAVNAAGSHQIMYVKKQKLMGRPN